MATLGVAAALAGCGGGGGDDATGGSPAETYDPEANTTMTAASISRAEFVKRVNEICRKAWVVVHDNWDVYTGTQDVKLSERERFAEAVQLSLLAGVDFHIFDNIRTLGAPPGEERNVEEIIGPFQVSVELGWKRRPPLYSVDEIVQHFDEYNRRASRYGLDDCLMTESRLREIEA